MREAVIDEPPHILRVAEISEALEGADPYMAVLEPHQHRRTRRRWLVSPLQRFARLDQREALAGLDAQGLQHFRR